MRWLWLVLFVGCAKKSPPPPVVDPFSPVTQCQSYLKRAKPALDEALIAANNDDMTEAKSLRDRAAVMGKARSALGVEPSVPSANAHYKRALAALDGLASALSTLAASREPNAPANPEVKFVAQKAILMRKDLDEVTRATASVCDGVK
jgi:hypothetical protein